MYEQSSVSSYLPTFFIVFQFCRLSRCWSEHFRSGRLSFCSVVFIIPLVELSSSSFTVICTRSDISDTKDRV